MFRIAKEFSFSASHQLHGLADGHPCGRLHGHNYTVKVILAAKTLDSLAFVVDFAELAPFKKFIDNHLDHRHLNDSLKQPTSEALAYFLFHQAEQLLGEGLVEEVIVSETPKTWASYRP